MNMTIKQIIELLKSNPFIQDVVHAEAPAGKVNRIISFFVRGVYYEIEWWVNVCTLHVGEMLVRFEMVELNGFWPNMYKNNLCFSIGKDIIVAIIPVEEYN